MMDMFEEMAIKVAEAKARDMSDILEEIRFRKEDFKHEEYEELMELAYDKIKEFLRNERYECYGR